MNDDKDVTYHIQSIRAAVVREWVGGVKADDSHLMQQAVGALLGRGMTEDEIVAAYKVQFA